VPRALFGRFLDARTPFTTPSGQSGRVAFYPCQCTSAPYILALYNLPGWPPDDVVVIHGYDGSVNATVFINGNEDNLTIINAIPSPTYTWDYAYYAGFILLFTT
jgi:hypothetical protein